MKDFFKSGKFKILVALTAVIIGIMVFSLTNAGYVPDSSSVFTLITEPFSRFSTALENGFSNWLSTFLRAEEHKEENVNLKEQIGELYKKNAEYEELKRENAELRALLELKEANDNITFSRPANIIARTVGDPYRSFVINFGKNEGIHPYDPVVTEYGLAGIVTEVTSTTATVATLFSPTSAVSVITARSLVKGIVEGDITLMEKNTVRMNYIDKEADIRVGDLIQTEGSEMFPPGQLVGIVEKIAIEENGLAKYAEVSLLVKPADLTGVYVITDFNGKGGNEGSE
jgi:rod shape-determining protein MreC